MDKSNFDITTDDRELWERILAAVNSAQVPDTDKLEESIKTLTTILSDMNSSFEDTVKKLNEFCGSLKTAVGTAKTAEKDGKTPTSEVIDDPKKSTSALSKSVTFLSKQLGLKEKDQNTKKGLGTIPQNLTDIQKEFFSKDKSTSKVLEWASGLAKATDSAMKGDFVGAALSAGKVLASVLSAPGQAKKEIEKFKAELERAVINYSVKVIAATKDIKSANDSIFDTDTNNKLAKGMEGYNSAADKMSELDDRLSTEKMQLRKKKKRVMGIVVGTKIISGDVASNYKEILKTDKDLVDSEGKLDMSIANALLQSGKLSDEAKQTITTMVEVQKAADDAMKQVNDTLTNMAGSIGNDLQTALVSAFKDGSDAADSFSKSISSMLEKIIADQMFNIIFGQKLKDLEDGMKASFSDGGDMNITDDIARFYNTYGASVQAFNDGMKQMETATEGMTYGKLDLFAPTAKPQSASSGGFASMSQEQGSELSGRFAAIQMTAGAIGESVDGMLSLQAQNRESSLLQSESLQQICSVNLQSMYYLEDIKKNTLQLYQINDKLGVIQQNTARL
jgi:hypothetical protein